VAFCAREYEKGNHSFRKDDITPYFSHPARVALLYQEFTPHAKYVDLAIVFAHDILEDCNLNRDDLYDELVYELKLLHIILLMV